MLIIATTDVTMLFRIEFYIHKQMIAKHASDGNLVEKEKKTQRRRSEIRQKKNTSCPRAQMVYYNRNCIHEVFSNRIFIIKPVNELFTHSLRNNSSNIDEERTETNEKKSM